MAWILAALSAPLCHLTGKTGWIEVAAAGTLCTVLNLLRFREDSELTQTKKWYVAVAGVCLVLAAGVCLNLAETTWPTGNTTTVVPLVLLVLAAWGAWEGPEKASRTGSVLLWFLVILFSSVVAGGVGNVKLSRIGVSGEVSDGLVYLVFLLPGIAAVIPRSKGSEKLLWVLPAFGTLMTLLVTGILSEPVAGSIEDPFGEFGKSLSLFGVVERYESLVSASLTIGYFCLISLLLSAAHHLAETVYSGKGRIGMLLTAFGAALTMNLNLKWFYVLAMVLLVTWYVIPVIMNKTPLKK